MNKVKVYIAYKFQNNKNKEALKSKLEEISNIITGWGFDNFILGRDVKKWKHVHMGSLKLIPVLYNNMKGCGLMIAYVNSTAFSKGLFFEIVISKILGIKSVMFLENGTHSKVSKRFFNRLIKVDSPSDIKKEHLMF